MKKLIIGLFVVLLMCVSITGVTAGVGFPSVCTIPAPSISSLPIPYPNPAP